MPEDQPPKGLSLADILDSTEDAAEDAYLEQHPSDDKPEGWDEEEGTTAKEGYCVECEGLFLAILKSRY